ncbi:hypothetical protein ABH932_001172 [Streptacidiphilus sp. MAP5-52]
MRISRRRLRSMAMLVGTAMCATLPAISAAHAVNSAPTVTVTVNGQTPGSTALTASGVVNISATITPVAGNPVQSVTYALGAVSGSIPVPSGQCATTCTLQASIDSAAVRPFASGGTEIPAVPDGRALLSVDVYSAAPPSTTYIGLVVNNHRPVAGQPLSPSTANVTATKQLSWTIQPSVSPTAPSGTTVTDVELEAPDVPGLPVTHFTKNADGSWTVTADTSSLTGGEYWIAAVATDSNGVVSNPQVVDLLVDSGFALSAPAATSLTPGWGSLQLAYTYKGNWHTCGVTNGDVTLGPTDVELEVDGQVWQDSPATPTGLAVNAQGQCLLPALGSATGTSAKPLPYGRHTLTWVVTDGQGIKESVNESVDVGLPLTSSWPTESQTVLAGSTIHLAPTISSPDGSSTLQDWSITNQNGTVLASGSGTTRPSLSLFTPANQPTYGALTLHLVSSAGLTTTQSFAYQTVWQTAAFAHLSAASVVSGTWVKISADLWAKVAGKWIQPAGQATVQYQWAYPGSGVWHNGSYYQFVPAGATLTPTWVRASSSACFRVVSQVNGVDYAPSTSAPVCLTVKP